MALPKVSIVIPSYKVEHFEQCLRSAIGQTYLETEILVSDNCPTEDIRAICARFPQVIYQRNVATRHHNVLTSLYGAKGHFIKPLFDDDLMHPFCIERMVKAAMEADDINLVFSASQVIDVDNGRVQERRPFNSTGALSGTELHKILTVGTVNVVGEFSSILIRREALWRVAPGRLFWMGEHDFSLGLADAVAYCNLVAGGRATYVDEELTYFRRDPRLPSNSNPASNPNIGYCYADGIELMAETHRVGIIDDAELLATEERVAAMHANSSAVFPQVGAAYQRYRDYLARLRDSAAGGATSA
jgi:glycosyltransferase involved in cell wall biosynthesis